MKIQNSKSMNSVFIAIIAFTIFTSCSKTNSKIVGVWENIDKKIDSIQTFSANGDYTLQSPTVTKVFSGKYEIKDGELLINFFDENGRKLFDNKYKITALTDDSMTQELQDGTKMTYRKQK